MTDEDLREAAALALGWQKTRWGKARVGWTAPSDAGPRVLVGNAPLLDWTTAGALLEQCPGVEINGEFGAVAVTEDACGAMLCFREWSEVTARNVIEACVMALSNEQCPDDPR